MTVVFVSVLVTVVAPLALLAALSLLRAAIARPPERLVAGLVEGAFGLTAAACVVAATSVVVAPEPTLELALGEWFRVASDAVQLTFAIDRLSLGFGALAATLLVLVARLSRTYLHRERGYFRYFFLLSVLGAGVTATCFAGSLDLLIFGWELVGVASALLIAFFHERPSAARHGLMTFSIYRVCDVGLLVALAWLHHAEGGARFVVESAGVRALGAPASPFDAHLVAAGLLLAAVGKAAQFPVSGWLPRAMEGPTPSSAIFYGALSIHLGPVLLLRARPLFEATPSVSVAIVIVGLLTAAYGKLVGRVQTDAKARLAYASMTQVGFIFAEIGLGLEALAMLHILGHATLRSYELLRAPSVIRDRRGAASEARGFFAWLDGTDVGRRIHRFAIERAYVEPFVLRKARKLGEFLREVDRRDAAYIERLERGAESKAVREAR